jgi:hypothetical protein
VSSSRAAHTPALGSISFTRQRDYASAHHVAWIPQNPEQFVADWPLEETGFESSVLLSKHVGLFSEKMKSKEG